MHEDFTPKRLTLEEILEEAKTKREKVASKLTGKELEASLESDISQILENIDKALGKKQPPSPVERENPLSPPDNGEEKELPSPFASFAKKQREKTVAPPKKEIPLSQVKEAAPAPKKVKDTAPTPAISPEKKEDIAPKPAISLKKEADKTPAPKIHPKKEVDTAPFPTPSHEKTRPAPVVLNAKQEKEEKIERGSKRITPPFFKEEPETARLPEPEPETKEDIPAPEINIPVPEEDIPSHPTKQELEHTRIFANPLPEEITFEPGEGEDESSPDWEEQFKKSRIKKISNFVLAGEEEEEPDTIEWSEEDTPEIEDFESPDDAPSIRSALNREAGGLIFRSILTLLTALASTTLLLLPFVGISIPETLFPEEPYLALLLMHAGLLLISVAANAPTVAGGIVALARLKPNGDSALAAASISVLAQSIVMLASSPDYQNTSHLFGAAVTLALFINSLGKFYIVNRTRRNFDFVADPQDTLAAAIMEDKELAQDLGRGLVIGDSVVAYPVKAKFLTRFMDISYREDYSQTTAGLLSALGLFGSLGAVLANAFFVSGSFTITMALSLFSASLCICIPIASLLSANLQLNSLSKTLRKQNALMTGFTVAEDFNGVNALAISSNDLFPKGAVRLHGIKTFGGRKIDDAILDAAALVCGTGSPLTEIFDMVIQGRRDILPEVDSIVYEEDMGLSGWVGGRRVLVGNRRLMLNHGIDVPSNDYEARYLRKDRNIVYLSVSGELTAMFIVSYLFSKKISSSLKMLEKEGVALIVSTSDPNITVPMLSEGFGISENSVKIMSPAESREYTKLRDIPEAKIEAGIAYKGPVNSFLRALTGAMRLNSNIRLISILQTISILIGFGVVLFFALTGGLEQINALQILCYQLFWVIAIVLVPLLRKP